MNLPSSPACQRNKNIILKVLQRYLIKGDLLEMGFGTGEHAAFFSQALKGINWFAADHIDYHWILNERKKT